MNLDAQLAVLTSKGGFTLEELDHNRRGRIHPRQLARERPGNGGVVFWIIVSLLAFGGGSVGGFLYYDMVRKPLERLDQNALYAIAGVAALIGIGALLLAFNTLRSARASRAQWDLGTCLTWDITFAFTQRQQTFADYFYVSRGNERLLIPRTLARVMRPGLRYRVYLADGRLISLEPIE